MNELDRMYESTTGAEEYAKSYAMYISKLVSQLDFLTISKISNLFIEAREKGHRIFFIGNGGSAATASHFANDIGIGTRPKGKPFKAVSLNDNNAVMTAIANDFGYEQLFVKQLENNIEEGDILVSISASGNSKNLLNAIEYAKSRGCRTIGLVGFDGGLMKSMVEVCLHVETKKGEYGPVEDIHMIVDHLLGTFLMREVLK